MYSPYHLKVLVLLRRNFLVSCSLLYMTVGLLVCCMSQWLAEYECGTWVVVVLCQGVSVVLYLKM